MKINRNHKAFLALVRSGLWEQEARLSQYEELDYDEIAKLAEVQSVVGLVTAGTGRVTDVKVPQEYVLQFIGQTLQLEERNKAMDDFIADLVEKMRKAGIYTFLVKGQGIAQCYEKPHWRSSGDVDFLLSPSNYVKAKKFLLPLSSENKQEERYSWHLGMNIGDWYVEIHGSMRSGLSGRVDRVIDDAQKNLFYEGNVRSWTNGHTLVFLPGIDDDIVIVFTHLIKHFYKKGLGLKQVCDWCRLLWTYKESVNRDLLEERIVRAGLMNEWKGFAAVAVDHLGMEAGSMPFYDSKFTEKGSKIVKMILGGYSGNKYKDILQIAKIYPWNTIKFSPGILFHLNWMKVKERVIGEDYR